MQDYPTVDLYITPHKQRQTIELPKHTLSLDNNTSLSKAFHNKRKIMKHCHSNLSTTNKTNRTTKKSYLAISTHKPIHKNSGKS